MSGTWTQTTQMSVKELAEFSRSLAQTISARPDADRIRAAVDLALGAECVQCGIRLSGSELLKFEGETSNDPRVERLRVGYCARNGCESHFYRVTCAPHPELNWPGLLKPADELTAEEKAAAEALRNVWASKKIRNKSFLRLVTVIAALLLVFIIRQLYIGGSIPFIREAEDFQVDREASQP